VVHPTLCPDGVGCTGFCPDELLLSFSSDHETLITQLEAVAGLAAFFTFSELFQGRRCVHWIDNYASLYCFVKGGSASPDMAALANMMHLQLAALDCDVFWDWVPSGANPADPISRPTPDALAALHAAGVVHDRRELRFPAMHLFLDPASFFESHPRG